MAITAVSQLSKLRLANKAEVSEFFGVSLVSINTWIKRGCPYVQEGSHNVPWVFDLLEVARWRFVGRVSSTGELDPEQMTPRERLDYHKGTRERMLMERDKGILIPAAEVSAAWADQISIAKGRLLSLPARVSGDILRLKSQRDIENTIKDAVITILEELANGSSGATSDS